MGTNYYAEWSLDARSSGPVELIVQPVALNLHIGKNMTMFQGALFNSWSAWKHFLVENENVLLITDEYGREWEVAEFVTAVEKIEPEYRRRQYDWVVEHSTGSNDWLCPDGFSFHAGEFS